MIEVMTFAYVMEYSHISTGVAFSATQVPRTNLKDLHTDTVKIKDRESDLKASLKKIQRKAEIGKYILQG